MGLLSKIIAAKVTTHIVQRLNEKGRVPETPRQQYIPANSTLRDRAVQVYRDNPKLLAGLGVVIAAAALQQLTRRRY